MQTELMNLVRSLYGHYCWGFDYGPILNLSFQIGNPNLRVLEPLPTTSKNPDIIWINSFRDVAPYGTWEFSVRTAYWRIAQGDFWVTGSSPKKQIQKALGTLSGQILKNIQVEKGTGATKIEYDLGGTLEIYRCKKTDPKNLWEIFFPDDSTLTVFSDGSFEIEDN